MDYGRLKILQTRALFAARVDPQMRSVSANRGGKWLGDYSWSTIVGRLQRDGLGSRPSRSLPSEVVKESTRVRCCPDDRRDCRRRASPDDRRRGIGTDMSTPHVVVLGAGPAGLGAAYQLARSGKASVTVLERNTAVGGNAGSFDVAGMRVDYGSHRLSLCEAM